MKTKELIAALQAADPSGEIEVCVDNKDIYFAEVVEAYWDGRLQRIVIDESKKPYYSVVGAKVLASGNKLRLHTMGVEDVLDNDPDAPVDLTDLERMPTSHTDWTQRVENMRKEIKMITEQVSRMDRKGNYHSCDRETYKKLKKVRFFAHVERMQQARHERWSRKLPHNRIRWSKVAFGTWTATIWEEPELCPLNLGILFVEYQNAKIGQADPTKVIPMKLDQKGIDAMIATLYEWSDRVYGRRA